MGDKEHIIKGLRKQKYYNVLSNLDNVDLIEANASFVSDKKLKVNEKIVGGR